MGKEIIVSSLEELCDLMCNNKLPEQGIRETCENCKYDRKECGNDDHYGFCNNWELKKESEDDKK